MGKYLLSLLCLFFLASASLLAGVWLVAPNEQYKKPSEVMALVSDGDTVLIASGEYSGDVGTWTRNDLVIRGVGGIARMKCGGRSAQQKAIWVVQGANTTIENIEFSECSVPDRNGAGIRLEGAGLTVRNCFFHDNENGILAGNNPESIIIIENSEFARNGYGDGQSHNLYINHVKKLIFRFNFSHHARVGHCLKSRAAETILYCNYFSDFEDGNSSYLIDLPNGGRAILAGNLLYQGPNAENRSLISFGREGLTENANLLFVANNTMINKRSAGATFISFAAEAGRPVLVNNIFAGSGEIANNETDYRTNLFVQDVDSAGFASAQSFDFRLARTSSAIDAGEEIELPEFSDLVPLRMEYKDTASAVLRHVDGKTDLGAYEFAGNNPIEPTAIPTAEVICGIGSIEVRLPMQSATDRIRAALTDLLGNRFEAECVVGNNCTSFPTSGLSDGMYFLEIEICGVHIKRKIFIHN